MSTITSHTGKIVWLYGRPCAGKTTIGKKLSETLQKDSIQVITLDGDELRQSLNRDLGFSNKDRTENIRRVAELAKMLAGKGFYVICSFVTPTIELRKLVRQIVDGAAPLYLFYLKTSIEKCMGRDTKGHYKQAREGFLPDFTGVGSPFEEPEADSSDFVLLTDNMTIADIEEQCFRIIAR